MNQKPSIQELYHFGIPGMKWGHRRPGVERVPSTRQRHRQIRKEAKSFQKNENKKYKANRDKLHSSYHPAEQDADIAMYGKKAAKYANRYMHQGFDNLTARELGRQRAKEMRKLKVAAALGVGYNGYQIAKYLNRR